MAYNYRNRGNGSGVVPAEKLIAVLSYFSFGIVGFAWIILGALMKQKLKPFLQYHIFQAIFIAFLFFILSHLLIFIVNILGYIPYLNAVILFITYALTVPLIAFAFIKLSIVDILLLVLIIYLSLGASKGKYSYIPWVSDIIKYNIGK